MYFFALLVRHKVAPFVLDKLLQHPLAGLISGSFKKIYKKEIAQALMDNQLMRRELTVIKTALDEQAIDFILLKGLSLAASSLRTTGDLDVLIKEADLFKAMAALRPHNYTYLGNEKNKLLTPVERRNINLQLTWNNQYQLYHKTTGLCLELHTRLFEKNRAYVEDLHTLWERLDLFWEERRYNPELQCFELSRECVLILMCLHNALKRSPANRTFLLRNVLDIDALVKAGPDWKKLDKLTAELKIVPFVFFSLTLTGKLMHTPIPSSLLESLRVRLSRGELFLTRLHLRVYKSLDTFSSFYSCFYKLFKPFVFAKSWRTAWRARLRALLILPALFPPRRRLAGLYRLKTTSPLLSFSYLLYPVYVLYRYLKENIYK